jgi:TP901 family phage tail tape measure protein
MAKGMSMKVLLELQSKEFQKGLKSIKRQLDGFARYIKSAFALGSITMFGRQMIQVGKDFENAMAKIQAVSNATQEEFKKMQDEAQRLGSTTMYTATEAAQALENLTRNGMSAANATKALSSVLQLAQANSISLAEAADIVTNTMNMFNLSVGQAGRVNDVLSATASHAATDITSLYEAMTNAAPAANVLGFSIEEVSSAIGALAQRGVKGAEAGTKLRIAFQKMADPKVIAKMKEQGIEIDETTMKSEGLLKTVQKLAKADLSLGQLGKIFDAKSAMAIQQLISGLDDLEMMLGVTANAAGETARMFNQSVGSVQAELDSLKSMYEGLLISMSQKTSGVVKSVVRLLQNLIINFESVGGTIMNIASVAVPLFINKVIQLGTAIKAAMQSAAAGMATLKASMGGIISLVATLVTWVGTALVGAWNRANKEMKEAESQMAKATVESKRTKEAVEKLKDEIGDGSDANSVNGAVAKAIKLFPEFADAIRAAAKVASDTKDFEKLKKTLTDIAELQNLIRERDAAQAVANARANKLGGQMYNAGSGWNALAPGSSGDKYYQGVMRNIKQQLKDTGFDDDSIRDIFNSFARQIIDKSADRKDIGEGIVGIVHKDVEDFFNQYEVKLDSQQINSIMSHYTTNQNAHGGVSSRMDVNQKDSTIAAGTGKILLDAFKDTEEYNLKLLHEGKKTQTEFAKDMYEAGQKMLSGAAQVEGISDTLMKTMFEEAGKYPEPQRHGGGGGGGGGSSTSKAKTDADLIGDAIKDYNEAKTKLDNRLAAGTIATEEYNKELDDLEDKTWETITAFNNFESILEKLGQAAAGVDLKNKYGENRASERHSELLSVYGNLAKYLVPGENSRPEKEDKNGKVTQAVVDVNFNYRDKLNQMVSDLETALDNGDFDIVRGDAIEVLNKLRDAAKEASEQADTLQAKLTMNEAITKLDEQIQTLSVDSFSTFNTMADAMDRVSSSLLSIAQVFDEDLKDSPFFQAFQAFNSVMNSSIQIMEAIMTVIQLKKQLEAKAAMEKVKNTLVEVAANKAATKSEMEKAAAEASAAAAGGANAVASIPIVGPALAVAAAGAIVAALLAAFSKFEKGGIVGGNSFSGDHNVVRANSGEMVLTKSQQRTLFDIANGKGAGGGQVEFKIRGSDLVGTLNNYDRLRR